MDDLFDLSGRVALVTGGNRGIGRSITLALARAGATVVVAARDEAKLAAVQQELAALGRPGLGVACDITQREGRARLVEAVRATYGRLNVLVNNAAIMVFQPVGSVTEEGWERVLATNLTAPFFLCQSAHPLLVAAGGGKIINLSSPGGMIAYPLSVMYGASKAAVDSMTRTLALAWAPDNIQVNVLMPGVTRTDMSPRTKDPDVEAFIARRLPAGRVGEPDNLGGAAVFLASRASDYMTGQALIVDGGALIAGPFLP